MKDINFIVLMAKLNFNIYCSGLLS